MLLSHSQAEKVGAWDRHYQILFEFFSFVIWSSLCSAVSRAFFRVCTSFSKFSFFFAAAASLSLRSLLRASSRTRREMTFSLFSTHFPMSRWHTWTLFGCEVRSWSSWGFLQCLLGRHMEGFLFLDCRCSTISSWAWHCWELKWVIFDWRECCL